MTSEDEDYRVLGVDQPSADNRIVYQRYIPVECDLCGTRMHATEDQIGQKLACVDCGREQVVAKPPVRVSKASRAVAVDDAEVFDLREIAAEAMVEGALSSCPHCGGKLRSSTSQADGHLFCQLCGQSIQLDGGGDEDAAQPAPRRAPTLADGASLIWPGVLTFPFKRGARGRLIATSLVFAITAWLIEFAFGYAFFGGGSIGEVLVGVCLFLGAALPLIGGIVFLAAVLLAILEDTAWENDDDVTWPDAVWIDWYQRVLVLINAVTFSAAPGIVTATVLRFDVREFYLAISASMFFLLPIILLSLEENNTMSEPFSKAVWKFAANAWWLWGLFYVLTALLIAVAFGAVWLLDSSGSFWKTYIASAVVIVGLMIYFRMMGRLARA